MSCNRYKNCLSYDDVLLKPQFSDIESRDDINISSDLGKGIELTLPLIASPMDTISEGCDGHGNGSSRRHSNYPPV